MQEGGGEPLPYNQEGELSPEEGELRGVGSRDRVGR